MHSKIQVMKIHWVLVFKVYKVVFFNNVHWVLETVIDQNILFVVEIVKNQGLYRMDFGFLRLTE